MSEYYVGAFSFSDYNAISHARTKGSKNGISTTKGYIPIGQRAQGRWDPSLGRYVYSTGVERARSKVNAVAGYAGNRAKRAASGAYNKASSAVNGAYAQGSSAARKLFNKATSSDTRLRGREYANRSDAHAEMARKNKIYSDYHARMGDTAAADRYRKEANKYNMWSTQERLNADSYYNRSVAGKIERFGRNASKFASESYSKVKNWISTAGSKASKAISSARTTLRKYGSMAVSSIKTTASSTAGKVKNFLSGLFKKKKKSTGTLKVVGTGGRVGTARGPHKRWD